MSEAGALCQAVEENGTAVQIGSGVGSCGRIAAQVGEALAIDNGGLRARTVYDACVLHFEASF
jgi:hypothetical protein